jgi:8-oxo-dGTP pyrophosphatase MutT (NUDIX family)/transcriptional regulator with XRE-family HTH domain
VEARVTVEEYVGLRIRKRREELEMSAVEFGSDLGNLLGKPWPRQAVSAAELGKRSLGAAELVAIAQVLRTSPTYLLTPPAGVGEITMPSGATVNRDLLFALVATAPRDDLNLTAVEATVGLLIERAVKNQKDAAGIESLARDLSALIGHRVALGETSLEPSDPKFLFQPLAKRPPGPAQPIVAAIVTSRLGVLVGKRNDGKPPWTFIAGEVEPGERAEDAAVRETKEETGLEIEAGEIIGDRVHPTTGRTMIYMAGRPVRGTEVFVGDRAELAEVRWVSLTEAGELLPGMYEPVRAYLERTIGGEGR